MRTGLLGRVGRDVCRHWQGRLSLASSFWIQGVALNVLLALWSFELARSMRDSTTDRVRVVVLTTQAVVCVVSVWQWVGVWRASGRRKTHFFARLLARACVLASVVHVTLCVAKVAASWHASACGEPWLVRVLGKPDETELRGPICDGASAALGELLHSHPTVRTLHVTSSGGLVNEGLRLATLVRAQHLHVVVDSSCYSACTLLLLAGDQRFMRPNARIGFHRMRLRDGRDVIPIGDDMASALEGVGASKAFVDRVYATSSDDIWEPSKNRLLDEHIISAIAQPDQFTYCPPYGTVEGARQAFAHRGLFAAMAEIDPERLRRIIEEYLAGPTRGTTQAEALTRLSTEQSTFMREATCHPAVAVARAYAAQLARLVTVISARFPDRCAAAFDSGIDSTGFAPEELGDDYDQVLKTFLVQSHLAPSATPSPEAVNEARMLRRARLSPTTLETIKDWKAGKRGDRAALCSAAVEYYRVMSELEPEVIARLLRSCPAADPSSTPPLHDATSAH